MGALQPPGVEAHFVVAACENMINERAVVPSDILTASNGKTIEVLNTDAEGRLTLADALVYCDKELVRRHGFGGQRSLGSIYTIIVCFVFWVRNMVSPLV